MKIPKAKKLKSGNYNITLRLDGECISITRSTDAECRQEAQVIKAEYLAGKRQKISADAKKMTLREVQERYVEKYKTALSPSTARSYTIYYKKRFPDYQNKKLPDITWQEMINKELEDLSQKTVKNAWSLVSAALKDVKYPMPEVKLAAVPVSEIAFLQPEEIIPFCEAVKGRTYEIPCLLMLHGLRLSEMRGLDWKNVDLINNTITIKESLVRGEDGNVTHCTDLKELTGLRLDTLRAVDDHDCGVRCHQGTVGILGEVLVTGGIQNVDAETAILELHDGRGDGNTTLLFDLHPVGGGGTGILLALNNACLGDGTAVEQEFFGQGGFTGVGVRDNGKGPATADFFN